MTSTIHNADCRDILRQLPDGCINMVIADPPYGKDFRSAQGTSPEALARSQRIVGDKTPNEAIATWIDVQALLAQKAADQCDMYVFTSWDVVHHWIPSIQPPWKYKMMLIWEKGSPGMGDIDSNWGCGFEIILYCKKGLRDVPHRRSAVLYHEQVRPGEMIHPTEKPSTLMRDLITFSTAPGELVFDPYSGSGVVAHAAKREGRDCIACEIDPQWIQRSRERLTVQSLFY